MKYTVSEIMFWLVRCEICGDELPDSVKESITQDVLEEIYKLSKPQDIAHIVANALLSRGILPDGELKNAFLKEQMTAVFRHAQIRHELSRLYRAFDEAKIRYIPLKGSVIRQYYPKPELRTSCDIDIFVSESELNAAAAVLEEKLGYTLDVRTAHDIAFYSQSKTHVELHFDLIENDERVRTALSRIWEMSHPDDGSEYRYLMENELFIVYHIAHMAKHFTGGGCGARPFIDLWIAKNKMGYNDEKVSRILSECGLDVFKKEVERLSEIWLAGAEHTELTLEVENYLLGTTIYGNMENRVAIMQAEQGGKFSYLMSRIFLPYRKLKKIYPRLEKYPILLPYYEIKRWFRVVFRGKTAKTIAEFKLNSDVSSEKQKRLLNMCDSLGLS